jgi:hypothetical protein
LHAGAKAMIRNQDITDLPQQEAFHLEPICMFVVGKKMTSVEAVLINILEKSFSKIKI